MTKKEMIDLLLGKVDPGKKDAFVSELKSVSGPDELMDLLQKYGITLTDDELKALTKKPDDVQELSDAELDLVSGGFYNAAGGYLSIKTNMRGVNVTVTNGAQSGMSSLCYAYNEIRQNRIWSPEAVAGKAATNMSATMTAAVILITDLVRTRTIHN